MQEEFVFEKATMQEVESTKPSTGQTVKLLEAVKTALNKEPDSVLKMRVKKEDRRLYRFTNTKMQASGIGFRSVPRADHTTYYFWRISPKQAEQK